MQTNRVIQNVIVKNINLCALFVVIQLILFYDGVTFSQIGKEKRSQVIYKLLKRLYSVCVNFFFRKVQRLN